MKKKLFHKDTFKGLRNAEYLKAIMKKFMLNKSKNDSLQQNGCCVIIKMKMIQNLMDNTRLEVCLAACVKDEFMVRLVLYKDSFKVQHDRFVTC